MDDMYNSYTSLLLSEELEGGQNVNTDFDSQNPNERAPPTRNHHRGGNFSIDEDKLLVSAWLNTSKDSCQGNAQNSNKYWQRIMNFFNVNGGSRTQASLKQRWNDINKKCQKFSGYLSQIEGRNQSGQTEHGRIDDAKAMYADLENKPFLLEHCWILLREEAKWQETLSNKRQKNVSLNESHDYVNLDDNDEASINENRPIGTKAAKKAAASGSKSSISDELLQERIAIERGKMEQRDRALIEQQKERELKEKEMERAWEVEVMTKDLRDMEPIVAEYWRNAQKEIMAKKGYNF